MDYIVASHNPGKRDELQRLLSPLGIRALLDDEAGIKLSDVEETGETFRENALLKAEKGMRESGMPCIADDSGLSVDYLNGAPGVRSARNAGVHGDDDANNAKLLRDLEGVGPEKRGASFKCVLCCVYPDGEKIVAEGECRGTVALEKTGDDGFGYDPLFLPDEYGGEKTMASLTAGEKDAISHRGAAARRLAELIKERNTKAGGG